MTVTPQTPTCHHNLGRASAVVTFGSLWCHSHDLKLSINSFIIRIFGDAKYRPSLNNNLTVSTYTLYYAISSYIHIIFTDSRLMVPIRPGWKLPWGLQWSAPQYALVYNTVKAQHLMDTLARPTWFEHDDVIKWKHFPRYWPFVRGIHRSPVNSPHKGQWRGALMFTLICARINGWVNNREAGDLRRYRAHYDVIVMVNSLSLWRNDLRFANDIFKCIFLVGNLWISINFCWNMLDMVIFTLILHWSRWWPSAD